jgi:hypothetical protein
VTLGRDGVAGLVCLAGSVTLLVMSRGLPQPALVPIGPAFYPRILLGITAVLAAALVVADLRRAERPAPAGPVSYRLVLLTFLLFVVYVFVLPLLGYRVATFLFVAALQATLEPPRTARGWLLVLASALVTTALTYFVFERYLSVLLPRGRLTGF